MATLSIIWLLGTSGCTESGGRSWQKLAELKDADGNRYVVAQQFQDWREGWKVSFSLVSSEQRIYGSLLDETPVRWRNVRIVKKANTVQVWRGRRFVGLLDTSARVFTNSLNGYVDEYVVGFNDVQGKPAGTNLYFDHR